MQTTITILEQLKSKVEKMVKTHHIEILKILKHNSNITLNENKSGVYVNLSFLPDQSIRELENYVNYIEMQNEAIDLLETQKESFKNTFFSEKGDKDEMLVSYSHK